MLAFRPTRTLSRAEGSQRGGREAVPEVCAGSPGLWDLTSYHPRATELRAPYLQSSACLRGSGLKGDCCPGSLGPGTLHLSKGNRGASTLLANHRERIS